MSIIRLNEDSVIRFIDGGIRFENIDIRITGEDYQKFKIFVEHFGRTDWFAALDEIIGQGLCELGGVNSWYQEEPEGKE